MRVSVVAKFWVMENYGWILLVVLAAVFSALFALKLQFSEAVAAAGGALSVLYFVQKQKLEEMRMFRELFREFNERYDKMNEDLARIATEAAPLTAADKQLLVDYFNLCGEEYLYYTKGYIVPAVWASWRKGMEAIMNSRPVRPVWEEEKRTGSYYGLDI